MIKRVKDVASRLLPPLGTTVPLTQAAWIFFLVALPVTSFPFFPSGLGGGTLVRPLSIYPMLVLGLVAILPRLIVGRLPRSLLALLPFLLVAFASTAFSLLRGIETGQEVGVIERAARALATLALGAAMYFTVAIIPRTLAELRAALRWLYIGFALALFWGSLQVVYILHFSPGWFRLLNTLQKFVSIRRLFDNRVSGLTYEPNWFADQISFLLLPFLLAAVVSDYTVFRWRWRRLTVEWILLIWAAVVLVFTFSRAGLFLFLASAFLTVLLRPRHKKAIGASRLKREVVLRRMVEGALIVVVLAAGIYFAGTKNTYFTRLWKYWQRTPDAGYAAYLAGYFEYIGFGARFIYWETAYRMYLDYPLMGVGLGNYAFYFAEHIPFSPLLATPEVERILVPEEGRDRLITSKNFYLRILSETGLAGAATFLAFFVAVVGCALYLWFTPRLEQKFWGRAAVLGICTFGLVAFSFDSLAIPNMWVVFGFITVAAHVSSAPQSPDPLSS